MVSFTKRNQVPLVGILWHDNILEKCFVTYSEVDPKPEEITQTIEHIVEEHYFISKEIKLVLIFNNILAGMGILNLPILEKRWNTPIIIISEKMPDNTKILDVIKNLEHFNHYKETLKLNPTDWIQIEDSRLFMLPIGITEHEAKKIITSLQVTGDLPEPLRVADVIAKAIH